MPRHAAEPSLTSNCPDRGLAAASLTRPEYLDDSTNMVRKPAKSGIKADAKVASTRKPNMREAILAAAEELFSTYGFNAVSVRDIAQAAGANPGSVTYHFKTKDGLLLEIYRRHCGPMNRRRSELLAAARRDRKSTRQNSSHQSETRMPSSA